MIAETTEFWLGYGATGVFLGRHYARYMHDEIADQDDPTDQLAGGWVGFLLGGAVWPLITAYQFATATGKLIGNKKWLFMARPPRQKRREAELERSRARTKQLEKELGL